MDDPRFSRVVAALTQDRGEARRAPSYHAGGFAAQTPGAVMGRDDPQGYDLGSFYMESVDRDRPGDRRGLAVAATLGAAIVGAWVMLWKSLDDPWVSIPLGMASTAFAVFLALL